MSALVPLIISIGTSLLKIIYTCSLTKKWQTLRDLKRVNTFTPQKVLYLVVFSFCCFSVFFYSPPLSFSIWLLHTLVIVSLSAMPVIENDLLNVWKCVGCRVTARLMANKAANKVTLRLLSPSNFSFVSWGDTVDI